MTFIGLGDFRQADPIVSRGGEMATLAASIKSSTLWHNIRILTLNMPIRSMGDPQFMAFVDHIGEDCSGDQQNLAPIAETTNFNNTVGFLFPSHVLRDPDICLQCAFLSPLNVYINEFNDKILDELPGDCHKYHKQTSSIHHTNQTT
jgi:hypothetical protein